MMRVMRSDMTFLIIIRPIIFAAGYVIRTLKLTCGDCTSFLTSEPAVSSTRDDLSLISIKDRGGLYKPNPAVTAICVATEKVVRVNICTNTLRRNIHQIIITQAMTNIFLNNTHHKFSTCHSTSLIKSIVSRYSLIRIRYEATKGENTSNLRQKLHRLVVFSHV